MSVAQPQPGMDQASSNFLRSALPDHGASVRLRNGRFVDVAHGGYFEPQVSVVLRGEKIIAMPGLPGQPAGMDTDFTIDLQGKAVIPGLLNTHCHLQIMIPSLLYDWKGMQLARKFGPRQIEKNMADCLAHGVTNIRDTWTEDLRMNRALKARIAQGTIPGPRIYQAVLVSPLGGTFAAKRGLKERLMFAIAGMPDVDFEDAASGVVAFRPDASPAEVRQAVDRAIDERGAECIKIYEQHEKRITYAPGATIMTQAQLDAAVDQSRRRGLRSTMHHLTVESFRRGVAAGISSLAHVPYDAPLTQEDVDAFLAGGCLLEPTLSLAYDYCWDVKGDRWQGHPDLLRLAELRNRSYAGLAEEYWLPELRDSVTRGVEQANRGNLRMFGLLDMSYVYRYYSGIATQGMANARLLLERGAHMACANDAGADPRTEAMVGLELALFDFVLAGSPARQPLSGADALRIATLYSAQAMGLADRFGTIEPGKTADLVVLDGDPLADYRVIGSRVAGLFMDGRLVIDNCGLVPGEF